MLSLRHASMRNVWIIASREYKERIRTRGFLITTMLIPLIMAGFVGGSLFLSLRGNRAFRIAVVSPECAADRRLAGRAGEAHCRGCERGRRTGRRCAGRNVDHRAADFARTYGLAYHREPVESGEFDGYLVETAGTAPGARPTFAFTPRSASTRSMRTVLMAALERAVLKEQLGSRGITMDQVDGMLQPVSVRTVARPDRKDSEAAEICVSVLFFVMYLVIMLYGMNVARSIIEEKTSRIFEVLLATIRPEALMAGKIIGVGSVGLTQVGIWVGVLLLLAAGSAGLHLGG